MTQDQVQYGKSLIDYSLEYAERKTLGIKVHPDKSVQVIAPTESTDEQVREKVKSKAAWILKQQDFFLSFQPMTPPRKYVSGETHLYLGKQYKLKVIEAQKSAVKLHAGLLEVYLKDRSDIAKIEKLLKAWYKQKAEVHFEAVFKRSLSFTQTFYKGVPQLKYRWMKQRWGSCDSKGCIHLNLELIKAPKKCIEYVIVHELCHLVHLNHSTAFYELLEQKFPKWKETKYKLEKLMV